MARSIRSRAPAPPGAAGETVGSLVQAPLGGSRAEAVRRLQMGTVGVVAVLLLIGLASIIKDRAIQTDSTAVAEAAATASPRAPTAAADPLAQAGVVPDIPASPTARATAVPANGDRPPTAPPAGTDPPDPL